MSKLNDVLLKYGQITQEQYDRAAAAEAANEAARQEYLAKGDQLTKQELQRLLDQMLD